MTIQIQPVSTRDYFAARQILGDSIVNGGGTWGINGEPVKSGVAVTTTVLATVRDMTQEAILAAIEALRGTVTDTEASPVYLGTWFDAENGVWEISQTAMFQTRQGAVTLATLLDERYVYDIDADECVAAS